jgi:hypothetical protein
VPVTFKPSNFGQTFGFMFRILITALMLLQLPAHAQKGFYLGFAGNATSSLILNQNTYGVKWNIQGIRNFELAYKATAGYGGAFKFGYNFKDQLGLEWLAGYQDMGMRYEDTTPNNVIHRKSIDLDYITIGMAFRYTSIFKKNRYKQEQKVRLAIVAGPLIGILVNAELLYSLEAELIDIVLDDKDLAYPTEFSLVNEAFYTAEAENDRDYFSPVEAGLQLQVGIDIYPRPWFYISPVVTGYIGLTDLNAKAYRNHSGYGASRHANVGLNLSMGFYINQ